VTEDERAAEEEEHSATVVEHAAAEEKGSAAPVSPSDPDDDPVPSVHICDVDHGGAAALQVAEEELVGERALDGVFDDAGKGTGSEGGVEASALALVAPDAPVVVEPDAEDQGEAAGGGEEEEHHGEPRVAEEGEGRPHLHHQRRTHDQSGE
jgi:hypothetical protein